MITSLGFDTIVIHTNRFYSDIDQAIKTFYSFGIRNFLFIFDFDPLCDSIAITKSKMNEFKNIVKISPLHVKIKTAFNLSISPGAAFSDSINQIYANKKFKALFTSLPLFTNTNYDPIALDINHLLYKKSSFLVFTDFEKIVETSSIDFCSKFITNSRICICTDLNYLLDPQKKIFFNRILKANCLILPSISKDLANYVGALKSSEFIIEQYGKKAYYNFCLQINRASTRFFI